MWQDTDSDGVSATPELSTLTDHGIASISLDAQAVSETLAGNRIDALGQVTRASGTTSSFAEVAFVVAGAPTTFSLGGIISTSVTTEESTDKAFVVDADSDGTTTGMDSTGTSGAVTLDDLSSASIAGIIEAIEVSSPSKILTSVANTLTVTTTPDTAADNTGAETSTVESGTTGRAITEVAVTEPAESAAPDSSEPQDRAVDGYAVYPPPSDPVVIASEPLPLAA